MKSSSLQFQIEKRTRNVFQLDEVYKACCFKPHLRKNPVAKTSKELVCFFCRSARFAVLQVLFSGSAEVAAGLSNFGEDRWGPGESDRSRISMHRSERSWHPGHSRSPRGLPGLPGDTWDALEGTGQVPRRPAGIGKAGLEQS